MELMTDGEGDENARHEIHRDSKRMPRSRSTRRKHASRFDGDESVLKEFFLFFQPVLIEQARRFGVEPALQEDVVVTFLDDKVLELAAMDLPPRALTGYVIRGFRNRIRNLVRDRKTRARIYDEAAVEVPGHQMLVAECHSQYGTSAIQGANHDELSATDVVRDLARFTRKQMTEEDVQLLVEASARIPLREIAKWHNISYAACRTRIHRLREKTRSLTREYLRTLPQSEKEPAVRFLRRAGALED